MPIVYKLSLFITALVIFCMALLGSAIIYNQTRLLREQILELGLSLADHLAKSASEPLLTDNNLSLEVLTTSLTSGKSVVGTAIINTKGEIVSRAGLIPLFFEHLQNISASGSTSQPIPDSWFKKMLYNQIFGMNVISFVAPIRFKDITAGYALISFDRKSMDQSVWQSVRAIVIATMIMVILGFMLAFLLSKRISRPIHRIADAIRILNEGSYDFRFDNKRQDEVGQLMSSFNQMADGILKKAQVENALSRYLSPKVAREVISNLESVKIGGKRVEGTVLFADIVGFTKMTEMSDPETIADILNHYFSQITKACELNRGMVDKYMGDCAMLVFGVPENDTDHCFHGVTCALLIKKLIEHENNTREQKDLLPVHFRLGINTGIMLAGNMGSHERMEYTVVGDTVNLASRLSNVGAEEQIIVSENFFNRPDIKSRVVGQEHASIKLRGIKHPVTTYQLLGLNPELQHILDEQFNQIISG